MPTAQLAVHAPGHMYSRHRQRSLAHRALTVAQEGIAGKHVFALVLQQARDDHALLVSGRGRGKGRRKRRGEGKG